MSEGERSPSESRPCLVELSMRIAPLLPASRRSPHSRMGGPMGQPKRVKPWRVMGMSDGRGEREASASTGMKRRDFARFSPTEGPPSSIMLRAAARSSGDPIRVPSSRYHTLRVRPGTSALMRSTIG